MSAAHKDDALVTLALEAGVARVTLNRGRASNALDLATATALAELTEGLIDNDDVQVVLLEGAGKNFCVGGDVAAMHAATDPSEFLRGLAGAAHRAVLALTGMRVPVVCAVQGAAAGAGLALTLAADIVVADPTARFLVAYAGVGLTPDCGTSWLLPRVVGQQRALSMALLPAPVDARRALDWGLVTAVSADGQAQREAAEIAGQLATAAPRALGTTRALVRRSAHHTLREHLDIEAAEIAHAAGTAESRHLIAAFLSR